jgi:hypothetical protein
MSANILLVRIPKSQDQYQIDLGILYQEAGSETIGTVNINYFIMTDLKLLNYTEELCVGEGDVVGSTMEIIPFSKIPTVIRVCEDRLRTYYRMALELREDNDDPLFDEFTGRIKLISDIRFILKQRLEKFTEDDNVFIVMDY